MTSNDRVGTAVSTDLIIFDCDGVLVDSEPLAMRVLLQTIAEAGLAIDPDEAYARFLGRSLASIAKSLSDDFGVDLTHEALERMRLRLYRSFREDLQPIPGIDAVLAGLSQRFCVASSSQMERIDLSLQVTGLRERFDDRIFSATMVRQGKPAPDLFLHAAAVMGVSPVHCLVIEDSPAGVEAARRAGMRAYGFVGGGHARRNQHRTALEQQRPDRIFEHMDQLPALLAQSCTAAPLP